MSEVATNAAVEPQPVAEAPKVEAPPDPYEGLSAEERAEAQSLDELFKSASPKEKILWNRLAQEKLAESRKPKEAEKAAETAAPDKADLALKKLEELEKREQARDAQAQAQERERRIRATINEAIAADADLASNERLAKIVRKAAIGELIESNPRDLKAATAALIKELRDEGSIPQKKVEQQRNERGEYIREKINDARETRGETRSSATMSVAEAKPTGQDFLSGKLFSRLSEKLSKV